MSNLQTLSDAQVVLLAAQFISDVNVQSLQLLAAERHDVLTRDLIYRLLLTLYPCDETARSALLALLRTIQTDFVNTRPLDSLVDISSVSKLSPGVADRLAKQLLLTDLEERSSDDTLADFIISWVHQVEYTDGALQDVVPLVEECIPNSSSLEQWASAYLLPLVRLRYQFYPGEDINVSLQQLESLSGLAGVKSLLDCAERSLANDLIVRDLNEIVAPWIEGTARDRQARKTSWTDVFEWLLDLSLRDFSLAAKSLLEWNGPPSPQTDDSESDSMISIFAQTALAIIYATQSSSEETVQLAQQLLQRAVALSGQETSSIQLPTPAIPEISTFVRSLSDTNLLQNALLRRDNALTQPLEQSLAFLSGALKTAGILLKYKVYLTVAEVTRVCISATAEIQNKQLQRILQQIPRLTSSEPDWPSIRQDVLWLRHWDPIAVQVGESSRNGSFLALLPEQQVEQSLLDLMLSMGQYSAAKTVYLESGSPPLDTTTVEKQVVAAIYLAFDNASNGNRSRGGVKRAAEMLTALRPSFSGSQSLRTIEHLLRATHSLSFYQLTLQHGVPFRPVNIRAHQDPLDLVARVLEQDSKAYTKLDDLLEIGHNLVLARALEDVHQDAEAGHKDTRLVDADRRVTYLAITAALAAHDFDTAYSYITTRLSTPSADDKDLGDDFSWRAVYAAGRHRPAQPPKSLHDRITGLSKRMDLLSLSLSLVPNAESLSEILGQWRRCEEEMDTLRTQVLREERGDDIAGDGVMPGGFGEQDQDRDVAETRQALAKRSAGLGAAFYEEEAPRGLFDVARGAASALRKSAFPLNPGSMKDLKIRDGHARQASEESIPTSPSIEDGRTRKRDMVSNMVTSGLVSGMGWVLGAQPANRNQSEHD